MVILVEHKIILMMLMTEMAFGGMNKSGIGHAGQHSGDDGDESGEVHDGVVSRFNTGVCFGIGGSVDCGNGSNAGSNNKMATEPRVSLSLLCALWIRGQ